MADDQNTNEDIEMHTPSLPPHNPQEQLIRRAEELIRVGGVQENLRFYAEIVNRARLHFSGGPHVFCDRTPLHLAALHGRVEIVRCILRRLSPSVLPNSGNLLAPNVAYAQDVVNARDRFGYTPLHLAIRGQDAADVPENDREQNKAQREEVVRLLTASSWVLPDRFIAATSGSDENGLECEGFTPLHVAAQTGNSLVMKLLLRQPLCRGDYSACEPVNIRSTTWNGDSALDIAKREGHVHLVELLECFDLNLLQSEREKNANSMNAVLVGAALVVAAAFAAWLQPPLGIPDPVTGKFSTHSNIKLAFFFLFVAFAFASSVMSLVLGIVAVIPSPGVGLKSEVWDMRKCLRKAAYLLFAAIGCLNLASFLAGMLVLERVSFAHNAGSKVGNCIVAYVPIVTAIFMFAVSIIFAMK